MNAKEYCCYTHPYSEIEGLQMAHTLVYSASVLAEGVVLELRDLQSGHSSVSRVLCPAGSFAKAMPLMRYLCENGIGPDQWLDLLDDLGQPYHRIAEGPSSSKTENVGQFVAFADFGAANLLHNTELTQRP